MTAINSVRYKMVQTVSKFVERFYVSMTQLHKEYSTDTAYLAAINCRVCHISFHYLLTNDTKANISDINSLNSQVVNYRFSVIILQVYMKPV